MNKIIIALLATTSLAMAAEGQEPQHRRWDVDGDKALTKEEWLARAAARFDTLDTNKDGKVTRDEGKAGRKEHREHRKERKDRREDKKDK